MSTKDAKTIINKSGKAIGIAAKQSAKAVRKTAVTTAKVTGVVAKETAKVTSVAAKETAKVATVAAKETAKVAKGTAKATAKAADVSFKATKNAVITTEEAMVKALDADGDGKVDINDIIVLAFKTPGVRINRAAFLKKELYKNHPQHVVDDAIARTPALAGISKKEIDRIADEAIKYERLKVSGISAALGAPGGVAMVATIPADIIQYYGYTLRATQKLLYLYGFPEIGADEEGLMLDSETTNRIILCLGVMYGVAGANNAIKGLAKALATGVEKQLLKMALTKGTFYPFVKSVMKWFGVTLTKSLFAGFFSKAIPVAGGILGGGITYLSFKPCCYRLKAVLKDTMLSNPEHKSSKREDEIVGCIIKGEIIDVDESDLIEFDEGEQWDEQENVDAAGEELNLEADAEFNADIETSGDAESETEEKQD